MAVTWLVVFVIGLSACGGSASSSDGGGDRVASGCQSAADCVDEVACNGIEQCVAGECQPGAAITCDDGLDCTDDLCREPDGHCEQVRLDELCPEGTTCTGTTGDGCEATCSASPCRAVLPQCGCPAGQACYIGPDVAALCVSQGLFAPGAACSGVYSCQRGYQCVTTGGASRCRKLCESDADCPDPRSICNSKVSDSTGDAFFMVCTTGCELGDPDSCPEGTECGLSYDHLVRVTAGTDCRSDTGDGAIGDPCARDTDCDPHLECFGSDKTTSTQATCRPRCTFPAGEECGDGEGCFSYEPPVVIEGVEYGACSGAAEG